MNIPQQGPHVPPVRSQHSGPREVFRSCCRMCCQATKPVDASAASATGTVYTGPSCGDLERWRARERGARCGKDLTFLHQVAPRAVHSSPILVQSSRRLGTARTLRAPPVYPSTFRLTPNQASPNRH